MLAEELGAGVDLELAVDVLDVGAHGEGGEVEAAGDFLVGEPVDDGLEHLALARGEQVGVGGGGGGGGGGGVAGGGRKWASTLRPTARLIGAPPRASSRTASRSWASGVLLAR